MNGGMNSRDIAFAGTGYREEKNNIEELDINPGLTLDLPIEQKIIEDNTVSVIYL